MKQKINKLKDKIMNLMFPNDIKCMFCMEELNQNSYNCTCEHCLNTLPVIKKSCARCGSPMSENQQGVCVKCKSKNFNFVQAKSIFEYIEKPLNVIHRIKYNGELYLVEHVVKYLLDVYGMWNVFADVVTSVPMFPTKQKERGFNQSSLFAEEFAKRAKLDFKELCDKIIDTESQTKLNTKERMKNVENSFMVKTDVKRFVKNKIVLIIDDVITTGATTSEVSKVLMNAGAKACYVLTFAHTNINQMEFENKSKN